MVNIRSFAGHVVSVASKLCPCGAGIDNTEVNGRDFVPVKLCLRKLAVVQIWTMGHSLSIPDLMKTRREHFYPQIYVICCSR